MGNSSGQPLSEDDSHLSTAGRGGDISTDIPQEVFGVITSFCMPSGIRSLRSLNKALREKIAQACQDRYIPVILVHGTTITLVYKYFYGQHRLVHVANCDRPPLTIGGGKAQPQRQTEGTDYSTLCHHIHAALYQTPDWPLDTEDDVQRWKAIAASRGLTPKRESPASDAPLRIENADSIAHPHRQFTPEEARKVMPFMFLFTDMGEEVSRQMEEIYERSVRCFSARNATHEKTIPEQLPPGSRRLDPEFFLQQIIPGEKDPPLATGREDDTLCARYALKVLMRLSLFRGAQQPVTYAGAVSLGVTTLPFDTHVKDLEDLITEEAKSELQKEVDGAGITIRAVSTPAFRRHPLTLACPRFAQLMLECRQPQNAFLTYSHRFARDLGQGNHAGVWRATFSEALRILPSMQEKGSFRRFSESDVKEWTSGDWREKLQVPFVVAGDPTFRAEMDAYGESAMRSAHTSSELTKFVAYRQGRFTKLKESGAFPFDSKENAEQPLVIGSDPHGGTKQKYTEKVKLLADQLAEFLVCKPEGIAIDRRNPDPVVYVADPHYLSIRHISRLYEPLPWLLADSKEVKTSLYAQENLVDRNPAQLSSSKSSESGEKCAAPPTDPQEVDHADHPPIDTPWILIGPTGSWSTEHVEPEGTHVWCHLFWGEKTWFILEGKDQSDQRNEGRKVRTLDKDKRDDSIGWYVVTQKEGETIFLPPDAVHIVVNDLPSYAIARNFSVKKSE